jgi:hypothetical protein
VRTCHRQVAGYLRDLCERGRLSSGSRACYLCPALAWRECRTLSGQKGHVRARETGALGARFKEALRNEAAVGLRQWLICSDAWSSARNLTLRAR